MKLQNNRLLEALSCRAVDSTPIWIMRQAGRYLPEYRAIRSKYSKFLDMCQNPDIACEITMLPLKRYDLDAAILFSDILILPTAMGMDLHFESGLGPIFSKPIESVKDIENLSDFEPAEKLSYVGKAVENIISELNNKLPLIGFAGSPWTVATYMIEGGSSKQFSKVKGLLYKNPQAMHQLLEYLAKHTTKYLQMQIDAGAHVVMLFDTWGGILTDPNYLEFSLAYMQKIIDALRQKASKIPVILFTKNGGRSLLEISNTGCNAVGLDWTADIGSAAKLMSDKIALQGNLDPCVLYAGPTTIREEVKWILDVFHGRNGHIFNLGHGIHPDIEPDNVQVMIDAVREYSSISRNL